MTVTPVVALVAASATVLVFVLSALRSPPDVIDPVDKERGVTVAASRAMLGMHWLTDVLAGLTIGYGWFLICAVMFGGRAQRLGDAATSRPRGIMGKRTVSVPSAESAARNHRIRRCAST